MKLESDPQVRLKYPRISLIKARLEKFITWCEVNKVTVVVALGNNKEYDMHEVVPSGMATSENKLITVGGVDEGGKAWVGNTKVNEGQASRVSVWAPANNVIVPGPREGPSSGTSQAAAIVVSGTSISEIVMSA